MVAFGAAFEKGKKIDPEKVLIGRQVNLMTLKKKTTKDGKTSEFVEVVEDSLKPVEPEKPGE